MGHSRKRIGDDGRRRYTAYYLNAQQKEKSAGTFATKKEADRAWQAVEASIAAGKPTDPRRGRITFNDYVDNVWMPEHAIEPTTWESYYYVLRKHIRPTFGDMRMNEIMPVHVRAWVTERARAGVSPATIKHGKIVLSAIFTTGLNDFVINIHPCRGVKSPTVPVKEYRIVTPEEFDRLYAALYDVAQLLVDVLMDSGLRWGELSELRVRDVHRPSGILTVSRSVAQVDPKFAKNGERFVVKAYPKGKRSRRFKLSPATVVSIWRHVERRGLGPDDLLFQFDHLQEPKPAPPAGIGRAVGHDRAERAWPRLPPRNPKRLHRRQVPVRALPAIVRRVPRATSSCRARPATQTTDLGYGWSRAASVVPGTDLEACLPGGGHRPAGAAARPSALACVVAASRRRGPTSSEGAARPPKHRDDREVPAHASRRGRDSVGGAGPRAQAEPASPGQTG